MEAKAIARHVRVTPRKARRMVDLIRGKKATEAVTILKFAPQAAALPVRKVLESAIANISALKGEKETEALFRQKASARRDAVNRYLWDMKTASTAITTGDANNWRCFPLPPLCHSMSVWRTMNRPSSGKRRAQSVTDTWRDSGKRVRNR